jgi:hypothetical protein
MMNPFTYGFAAGLIATLALSVGWGIRRSEDAWEFVGEYLIPGMFFDFIVALVCGLVASGFVDGWG